jgi:L-rhamnose mutarotase
LVIRAASRYTVWLAGTLTSGSRRTDYFVGLDALLEDIMKRVGFLLQVKKDKLDEYKKHHEAVWPEMLEALRRHGWHNYSLYMRDDGLLFGYFEAAENFQASLDGMATEAINLKWQEFMGPYFETIEGRPDEAMIELEEVFHLD